MLTVFVYWEDLSWIVATIWPAGQNFLINLKTLQSIYKHVWHFIKYWHNTYKHSTSLPKIFGWVVNVWIKLKVVSYIHSPVLSGSPEGLVSLTGCVPQVSGRGCSNQTTHHSDGSTACSESAPSHPHNLSSLCWLHTCGGGHTHVLISLEKHTLNEVCIHNTKGKRHLNAPHCPLQ